MGLRRFCPAIRGLEMREHQMEVRALFVVNELPS